MKCQTYKIECPFAMPDFAPVPCIGSFTDCETVRLHYSYKDKINIGSEWIEDKDKC